jgi:SNF2 family DNA or RNA helicase
LAGNTLIEQKALSILETYEGANNYLLKLKTQQQNNPKFYPTRSQSDYIINFCETQPKIAKKWVELDPYFAKKIADEKLYIEIPKEIWIEKLLVEKDKSYHIWGKVFSGETNHDFWLPKQAVIQSHIIKKVDIDYTKYDHRPPLNHQKEAIEKLAGSKKFILADDMGLGKTTSTIIASLETGAKKVLIICPASLKINWAREIKNYTDRGVFICEGKKYSTDHDFVIVNYDIVKNFYDVKDKTNSPIHQSNFDLVILDECFTYDTKIMTDKGELNIGDIVENNLNVKILSFNINEKKLEYKKINRWIRKNKDIIYKIKLNNGVFIECTDNHKFYVNNKGYVKANELTTTDDLYMLSQITNKKTDLEKSTMLLKKLCIYNKEQSFSTETKGIKFSQKLFRMWEYDEFHHKNKNDKKNILFFKMFKQSEITKFASKRKKKKNNRKKWRMVKTYDRYSQKKSTYVSKKFGEDEKKQPYEKSGKYKKNERKIKRENFFVKGWKWENNSATRTITSNVRRRLGNGITNINGKRENIIQKFTSLLQSRYRKSKFEINNRNRWEISQNKKMEIFGQEEDQNIKFVRVESVEILERGSYDKSTNVYSKNTRVYDLEIQDNHNYFANSVLVSNCHYIQNPQAQRTKLINHFAKTIDKIWLLSGTPMTSRPINYFNLLNLIDSPVAQNWMAYAIRYCQGYQFRVGNRKIWNTSGASNLEELRDRTSKQVLRRLKTEVLDLPDKIVTPIYLRLKSKEYEDLMGDYYDWYDKKGDDTGSLTVQFTKIMKVRQVIANEKIESTIELCENILEQDKKVIVFTNFTETLHAINSHFGKKSVYLDGSMTKTARQDAVDRFQNDDKIKVFVGNMKAAGVGITLTAAETVIFNDLSFVPSDHSQAEDRAFRYGQKNNVLVYYPIFENTIEGIIYDILANKKNIIDTVMGDNMDKADAVQEIMSRINKRM